MALATGNLSPSAAFLRGDVRVTGESHKAFMRLGGEGGRVEGRVGRRKRGREGTKGERL